MHDVVHVTLYLVKFGIDRRNVL